MPKEEIKEVKKKKGDENVSQDLTKRELMATEFMASFLTVNACSIERYSKLAVEASDSLLKQLENTSAI